MAARSERGARGAPSQAKPPSEVAADPSRLAKWSYTMFEVSGCDHTQIIGCRRGKSAVFCRDAK